MQDLGSLAGQLGAASHTHMHAACHLPHSHWGLVHGGGGGHTLPGGDRAAPSSRLARLATATVRQRGAPSSADGSSAGCSRGRHNARRGNCCKSRAVGCCHGHCRPWVGRSSGAGASSKGSCACPWAGGSSCAGNPAAKHCSMQSVVSCAAHHTVANVSTLARIVAQHRKGCQCTLTHGRQRARARWEGGQSAP